MIYFKLLIIDFLYIPGVTFVHFLNERLKTLGSEYPEGTKFRRPERPCIVILLFLRLENLGVTNLKKIHHKIIIIYWNTDLRIFKIIESDS